MIFTILMVITIVVCVLLAIFILAQNPKGGGLLSVVLTAKPSAVVIPSVEQPVKNTPAPVQSENTSSSVNK